MTMPSVSGPCVLEVEYVMPGRLYGWRCTTCSRGQNGYPSRESADAAARSHAADVGLGVEPST